MNVRKQKELIEELMQTALIVRDFESRYNLSLELLKLNAVEPMPEETIMKIRQKYKLNSAVWIKAELTVQEGTEMKCSICKSKLSGEPMKLVGRNRPLTVCDDCVNRLNVTLGYNLTKVSKERKAIDKRK